MDRLPIEIREIIAEIYIQLHYGEALSQRNALNIHQKIVSKLETEYIMNDEFVEMSMPWAMLIDTRLIWYGDIRSKIQKARDEHEEITMTYTLPMAIKHSKLFIDK
jgi:hypothetical protein